MSHDEKAPMTRATVPVVRRLREIREFLSRLTLDTSLDEELRDRAVQLLHMTQEWEESP